MEERLPVTTSVTAGAAKKRDQERALKAPGARALANAVTAVGTPVPPAVHKAGVQQAPEAGTAPRGPQALGTQAVGPEQMEIPTPRPCRTLIL